MSSAVYIKHHEPVQLADWLAFAATVGAEFSPQTIGQDTFYVGGGDGVQIVLGGKGWLPVEDDGRPVFSEAIPPLQWRECTVSSYWMRNLDTVARVARAVLRRFPGTWEADDELDGRMRRVPGREEGD